MEYGLGSFWGLTSFWGLDENPFIIEVCDLADTRVLVQMDDTAGNNDFRQYICETVKPWGEYAKVLDDVKNAFDIETAAGEQLDYLGEIVGIPRREFTDDRYRTFVKIQIDLILSSARSDANWTGTTNNILTICREFLGVGPALSILNSPPYSYVLNLPALPPDEQDILFGFLCKATYAGVLGYVLTGQVTGFIWGSQSVVVPSAGIWGSQNVAVPGAATWGSTTLIGGDQSGC
jgi:hypothetical protein